MPTIISLKQRQKQQQQQKQQQFTSLAWAASEQGGRGAVTLLDMLHFNLRHSTASAATYTTYRRPLRPSLSLLLSPPSASSTKHNQLPFPVFPHPHAHLLLESDFISSAAAAPLFLVTSARAESTVPQTKGTAIL